MALKNIILFRGENNIKLHETVRGWRQKFIEKHSEINLLEIQKNTLTNNILADALTPGFMGSSRMIILYDFLTDMISSPPETEDQNDNESSDTFMKKEDIWIETLQKVPDNNFLLFIGNKKTESRLEEWLEKEATVYNFTYPTPQEMRQNIQEILGIGEDLASFFCEKLGFYEEIRWGKRNIVGTPNFVYQEIEKIRLLGRKKWTLEELDAILPDYRDENAFNMLEPLWDKQGDRLINTWKRLMETADHELSMAMMITMIRKILISTIFPRNNLPITPGQKKTGERLQKDKKRLKKLYDDIISVDIAEKSGELPNKTNAFLMALLNFCL